ncbi:hypothetical protein BS47DRAFT_1295975 [Hydnum rufescens UP504]|uniref:Acyl carrier protein n=1 Tax=Hydnum rufescens UP504 TaxID=1448309 RepID=A0A9P6DWF3_9AGAM|nr:hypothetical protein BS47DRAFT_1295975 [Hydnum rufescens UP504]
MSILRLRTPFRALLSARPASTFRPVLPTRPFVIQQLRGYSAAGSLSKEEIQNRVLDVLKSFEKVKPEKLTVSSSFAEDLGLDSLDAVEVVMAEFAIEIPDEEADAIKTVQQAIDYISKTPAGRSL